MRVDLVLAFLLAVISVLIWAGALAMGVMLIARGIKRKIKVARIKGWFTIILGSIFSSLIFLPSVGYLYVERLWFGEMGYTSVFWKMTLSPWLLFLQYGLIATAFMTANFILAQKLCPIPGGFRQWATGKTGSINKTMILIIVIVSIVMGSVMLPMWDGNRLSIMLMDMIKLFWTLSSTGKWVISSLLSLSAISSVYGRKL